MKDFSMLLVIGAVGAAIGFYMGESRSDEPGAPAIAAAPAVPVAEGTGYLPAQLAVQAKDVLPLPATF
jgi:hypothetical protein